MLSSATLSSPEISISRVLPRLYLYPEDHLYKCSCFTCLRQTPFVEKREEYSGSRHAKSASLSFFSSHSQARADRLIKHLPLRDACTTLVRAVVKIGKRFTHRTHVGSRHRRDVKLQSRGKQYALRAPLQLCASQKIRPVSALVCFVRFFLTDFAEFSARSWWRDYSAPASCSNHDRSKAQKKYSTCKKKTFLKSPFKSHTSSSLSSTFLQRIDVIFDLFRSWAGIDCQLPFIRHARVLLQMCLRKDYRQHLLVGKVVLLNLPRHSFGPAYDES